MRDSCAATASSALACKEDGACAVLQRAACSVQRGGMKTRWRVEALARGGASLTESARARRRYRSKSKVRCCSREPRPSPEFCIDNGIDPVPRAVSGDCVSGVAAPNPVIRFERQVWVRVSRAAHSELICDAVMSAHMRACRAVHDGRGYKRRTSGANGYTKRLRRSHRRWRTGLASRNITASCPAR